MNTKKIYFLEGNISGGKSTALSTLSELGYNVYQEPINVWMNDYVNSEGENILGLFYKDKRYSFQFEVLVMITRWNLIKSAINSEEKHIIIERSLDTDANVFAKCLLEDGNKTELDWKIYKKWYSTFKTEIEHYFENLDITYIYIRTNPNECHSRIMSRARSEESTIPLDYIIKIHNLHDEWLNSISEKKVCVIDGNKSKDDVINNIINIISLVDKS